MGAALNDQQLAAVEQQMSADPSIQQGFQAYQKWAQGKGRMAYIMKGPPTPQQILAQHGIDFPDISDYQILTDPQGQVRLKRENWFQRNADWIVPVATFATAGLGATATTAPAVEAGIADAAVPGLATTAIPGGVDAATMAGVGSSLPAGGVGLGAGAASAVPSILDKAKGIAGKVAPILGNMADAGAKANAQRDAILPSMENSQLARDKYALDAPGTRLSQSVRASGIKNASPTQVNWGGPGSGLRGQVPTFTGGFSGELANMDPQTKALAEETMRKDLQDQLAGKDDQTRWLDKFGSTSPLDKAVGIGSTAASIFGALRK
jgi:hypothetical protein